MTSKRSRDEYERAPVERARPVAPSPAVSAQPMQQFVVSPPSIPPVLLQQRDTLLKRAPPPADADAYAMWQRAMQDIEARIAAASQGGVPPGAGGGGAEGAGGAGGGAGARAHTLALAAQLLSDLAAAGDAFDQGDDAALRAGTATAQVMLGRNPRVAEAAQAAQAAQAGGWAQSFMSGIEAIDASLSYPPRPLPGDDV